MKVEGPKFRLWFSPDISVEERAEAAHAICRFLIDPPQSPRHRRAVAVRQAMNLYQGPPSRRAKELSRHYATNLAGAWPRERDPPAVKTIERHLRKQAVNL